MKKKLFPIISLLIGFAIALVLIEAGVRIFFDQEIMPRFVIDSGHGVRFNQSNAKMHHYVPHDYEVDISNNSAGLRGEREYSIAKPADTYRIALIGDSFVYGFGVNNDQVVSTYLEDWLNRQNPGKRFEVLNFGVSGFGQAEELVTYEKMAKAYQPDEVVLFYFNNDIGNNAVAKLYEVNDQGELLRTGNSYLPGVKAREILYGIAPVRWLFTHSHAWNLIRNRLSALVQNSKLKEQGMGRFDDSTEEGVKLTRALLREFTNRIHQDNARPTLFIIPDRENWSNFPMREDEMAAIGVPVVNGRELFESQDYYINDSHWRPSGHEKAAEALGRLISTSFRSLASH